MRSLLDDQARDQDEPARINLYGLPAIEVRDSISGSNFAGEDGVDHAPDAMGHEADRIILVNARPHLDFILKSAPADNAVVITRTDEMSLLQSYAFIKVMHMKSNDCGIGVVFEGAVGTDPQHVFGRLSGYISSRLKRPLHFLGVLVHDESMERSIREERPLVLQAGTSEARNALTTICSSFIDGQLKQQRGAGT